ncbi:MAG: lipopolysaccharide export system protein LptC [Hyphomicrobiales bacterium]|jgi:lipopolysaccharide export system protein LptC|nr:lipopolysaccharide export system protein LptC [Hyphomicrobiales bacterium]
MAVTAIEAPAHGWTASRRSDLGSLVRAARRHSRLVRFARIAVPAGVAAGLTVLVLVSYFEPLRMLEKLPSVSGKLGVQGSKITMELPKIAGFTRDSRSYEMTAETAVQDLAKPDMIDLKNLRATIELPGQNIVQILAGSGVFNTKTDQITMRDQVTFSTAHGYRGKVRQAAVDMKVGRVLSDDPIELTLPDGLLKANRMEILDSGDVIRFEGGVVLTLDGDKPAGAQ